MSLIIVLKVKVNKVKSLFGKKKEKMIFIINLKIEQQ